MSARGAANLLVVLALAAVLAFLPGAGTAAALLNELLRVVFLGALVWFAARLYREQRLSLFSLGDRHRGLLYGAIVVVVLTLTATGRLWALGGVGALTWFALMGGACYAAYVVFRAYRAY